MFLDRIVTTKLAEVEQLRLKLSPAKAEQQIAEMKSCLGFEAKLTSRVNRPMGLIAEVKKASPSKGLIREQFHPIELAESYERAGADCISVLTDVDYFQGSNAYLEVIRKTVNIPLLRKDFTIDPLQIYEARMLGADAVLLIAAILSDEQLKSYLSLSRDLGMDVLVEVHDRSELERALELDATLIGINNRDLRTFVTDLKTTEELIAHIPSDRTVISESGITGAADIGYLQQVGAHGVLVGEHLMRQQSVEEAVYQLVGRL
ncbi:indole-3-glycerol phosphate synthase TrpC [Paenibacillus sp. N1-5-1-14]|uniref:indole-3-glycerol phosphate synthase TrpC n=1 Tax=Paenibacillus radicibacter TaxID=2972488 RepID=UPI0021590A73|nr:indole-3-glycerol phosphate synthase TrpC [Paenibacillus radicibacter]MCR8642282.1 indole-3-glycerol phosphate synthase TrpC [Paenibacillus radicibacter]